MSLVVVVDLIGHFASFSVYGLEEISPGYTVKKIMDYSGLAGK